MAKKYKEEIKCPLCRGDAKLASREHELFGGKLVLKDVQGYKCEECKEVFSTSAQVREAEENLRKAFFFKRKVISTGGSLAITLPQDISEYYHLKKGSQVRMIPQEGNAIKIIAK